MTVEQRKFQRHSSLIERETINPGDAIETEVVVIEGEHPHEEFPMRFNVSCSLDDSHGTVIFEHPETGKIVKDFSGKSIPFYMIRMSSGALGLIEWEHKPGA